jgi:hypothetical protein
MAYSSAGGLEHGKVPLIMKLEILDKRFITHIFRVLDTLQPDGSDTGVVKF